MSIDIQRKSCFALAGSAFIAMTYLTKLGWFERRDQA
jgi:hypothetical protein